MSEHCCLCRLGALDHDADFRCLLVLVLVHQCGVSRVLGNLCDLHRRFFDEAEKMAVRRATPIGHA